MNWFSKISQKIIPSPLKKKLNNAIYPFVSGGPKDSIPLNDIFGALKSLNVYPVDEDGTPWGGILTGKEGRITIDLAIKENESLIPVDNSMLVLSWHKFDTGRYEVSGYIS